MKEAAKILAVVGAIFVSAFVVVLCDYALRGPASIRCRLFDDSSGGSNLECRLFRRVRP